MSTRSKRQVRVTSVVVAFIIAGIPARPATQGRGDQAATSRGRASESQPTHAPGPSGPYSRADLAAAQPFDEATRAVVTRALRGSIDIHMHTDPDIAPRPVDSLDVVKLAQSYGLRAIVLKNHYEPTTAQAYIMRKLVSGIEVYGGMTLDLTNGGVNPAAVEHMAKMKGGYGKLLWFPTYDSEASVRNARQNRPFAQVSKEGTLTPESREVVGIVKKYNLVLATGHVSPEEGLLLVQEARAQGVPRQHVVVTHAVDSGWNIPQMQEAAKIGAFIEFAKPVGRTTVAEYAEAIRKIGPDSCIVSETGVSFLPQELIGAFVAGLLKEGFTERDLDRMMRKNPAQLLGLPDQ